MLPMKKKSVLYFWIIKSLCIVQSFTCVFVWPQTAGYSLIITVSSVLLVMLELQVCNWYDSTHVA